MAKHLLLQHLNTAVEGHNDISFFGFSLSRIYHSYTNVIIIEESHWILTYFLLLQSLGTKGYLSCHYLHRFIKSHPKDRWLRQCFIGFSGNEIEPGLPFANSIPIAYKRPYKHIESNPKNTNNYMLVYATTITNICNFDFLLYICMQQLVVSFLQRKFRPLFSISRYLRYLNEKMRDLAL